MASKGFDSIPWLTETRQAPVSAPPSSRPDPFAAANAARDSARAAGGFDEEEEWDATTRAFVSRKKMPSKTMLLRVAPRRPAPPPPISNPKLFEIPPPPVSDPYALEPASKPMPTRPIWIVTGILLALLAARAIPAIASRFADYATTIQTPDR